VVTGHIGGEQFSRSYRFFNPSVAHFVMSSHVQLVVVLGMVEIVVDFVGCFPLT
jgi:hypothetical protein